MKVRDASHCNEGDECKVLQWRLSSLSAGPDELALRWDTNAVRFSQEAAEQLAAFTCAACCFSAVDTV